MNLLVVVVPPALVALIFEPETTPAGTVTTIEVALTIVNGAATSPMVTAETEPRLLPVRVMVEPTSLTKDAGIEIVGFAVTAELDANAVELAAPPELVTTKAPF